MIALTWFNATTVLVIVLTLWVMWLRKQLKFDSNLPLLYYAVLVFYSRAYEGAYYNYAIMAGVLAGLFLRFEFLGGWPLKSIRTVEFVVHCYVLYMAVTLLFSNSY